MSPARIERIADRKLVHFVTRGLTFPTSLVGGPPIMIEGREDGYQYYIRGSRGENVTNTYEVVDFGSVHLEDGLLAEAI